MKTQNLYRLNEPCGGFPQPFTDRWETFHETCLVPGSSGASRDCLGCSGAQGWESGCTIHLGSYKSSLGLICFISLAQGIAGIRSWVLGPGIRAKL